MLDQHGPIYLCRKTKHYDIGFFNPADNVPYNRLKTE